MVSVSTGADSSYQIDVQLHPNVLGSLGTGRTGSESSRTNQLLDTGVKEIDDQFEKGITRLTLHWLLAGCPDENGAIERYLRQRGSEDNDSYLLFSRVDTEELEAIARSMHRPGLHQDVSLAMIREHAKSHIDDGTLLKGAILPYELIDKTSEVISRKLVQKISIHSDVSGTSITLHLSRLPSLSDFPLMELGSHSKSFLFQHQAQLSAEIDGFIPDTLSKAAELRASKTVLIEDSGDIVLL